MPAVFTGPTSWRPLGFFSALVHRPLDFLSALQREHGDYARFRMLHEQLYLISDPAGIRHILVENHAAYRKSRTYDFLARLLGDGLVTSEGELWKRQRRLIQPEFTARRLAAFLPGMIAASERACARYARETEPIDAGLEMARLTLGIVGQALFQRDLSAREAADVQAAIDVLMRDVDHRLNHLLTPPAWVPTPRNRRVRAARQTLDALIEGLIADRRRGDVEGPDLLARMMALQDGGVRMDARQLRDEMVTMIVAGHETTGNALAWCLDLLSRHPEVLAEARAELSAVLGERAPEAEDLPRLRYLRQVIDETLRLYPPAWMIERVARVDDVVEGHPLPAGAWVMLCPWVVQRAESLWEAPEEFRPSRFSKEHSRGRPRYAYFPFGGGPRVCIGKQFALMEMVVVLAALLRRFDLVRCGTGPTAIEPLITLKPLGLKLRLVPRGAA